MLRWLKQFWCGLKGHGGWTHVDGYNAYACDGAGWWVCKRCGKREDFHASY